jgi:GrpB-like predicted nucleotidyltransferase (UPF0157 family)
VAVSVVPYSDAWPTLFEVVAAGLRAALATVPVIAIEHVGSTAVPGLAAKPILDIDVIVERAHLAAAMEKLRTVGYVHSGDLGLTDREAFVAPATGPKRHVYVCVVGTLHVRNHLAVRDALREHPELRDRYAATKLALAEDPTMDISGYLAGKSAILLDVLVHSALTEPEKQMIYRLNALPTRDG